MIREQVVGWMKRQSIGISFILGLVTAATIGYTVVNVKDTAEDNTIAIRDINAAWRIDLEAKIRDLEHSIHSKQLVCKDLEIAATIASINSTYTRCKQ